MRLATVRYEGSTSAALVVGDQLSEVAALPGREGALDVISLIEEPLSPPELAELTRTLAPLDFTRLLAPILSPPKNVLCVGRNYVDHVREGARAAGTPFVLPTIPVWFTKPHTSLIGSGGTVVCDPAFTRALDFEAELAVVIGKGGRGIARAEVGAHIFGYTILNDITARDRQEAHGQWFKGKSADTYAPCGPWIVTAQDVPDPQRLRIQTRVNGEVRQDGNTEDMIFDIPELIADLSQSMTLEPGDLITTGTPMGVGWGQDPPVYLEPGDELRLEIEGIGQLRNRIGAPQA